MPPRWTVAARAHSAARQGIGPSSAQSSLNAPGPCRSARGALRSAGQPRATGGARAARRRRERRRRAAARRPGSTGAPAAPLQPSAIRCEPPRGKRPAGDVAETPSDIPKPALGRRSSGSIDARRGRRKTLAHAGSRTATSRASERLARRAPPGSRGRRRARSGGGSGTKEELLDLPPGSHERARSASGRRRGRAKVDAARSRSSTTAVPSSNGWARGRADRPAWTSSGPRKTGEARPSGGRPSRGRGGSPAASARRSRGRRRRVRRLVDFDGEPGARERHPRREPVRPRADDDRVGHRNVSTSRKALSALITTAIAQAATVVTQLLTSPPITFGFFVNRARGAPARTGCRTEPDLAEHERHGRVEADRALRAARARP